jgi:hypothetical protein
MKARHPFTGVQINTSLVKDYLEEISEYLMDLHHHIDALKEENKTLRERLTKERSKSKEAQQ